MVELPSVTSLYLSYRDKHIKAAKKLKKYNKNVYDGHDIFRNELVQDKERLIKRIMLEFPPGIYVTNKIYSLKSAEENGLIQRSVLPVKINDTHNDYTFKMTSFQIMWKVSLVENRVRCVGELKLDDEIDDLADFCEGMDLNADGDSGNEDEDES